MPLQWRHLPLVAHRIPDRANVKRLAVKTVDFSSIVNAIVRWVTPELIVAMRLRLRKSGLRKCALRNSRIQMGLQAGMDLEQVPIYAWKSRKARHQYF